MKSTFHLVAISAIAVFVLLGCDPKKEPSTTAPEVEKKTSLAGMFEGTPGTIPGGELVCYARLNDAGDPEEIGYKFKLAMLDKLPKEMNKDSIQFDINGNGKIEIDITKNPPLVEFLGDYSVRLDLPEELQGREDIPFTFLRFDWNPMGHPPMGWMTPHSDFHFYMVPQSEMDAIEPGPLPHVISEASHAKAMLSVPPKYLGKGFVDTDPPSTVGGMGNHLIDETTPEIMDPKMHKMTYTWIYGTYGGHVTFWEPMISSEFLNTKTDAVVDIKLPEAYEKAGWYPTKYAIRHHADGTCTVGLEGFVKRAAG